MMKVTSEMHHYLKPGIAKALAARVVALRVKLGLLKIRTPREYRDAILRAAHSAWMDIPEQAHKTDRKKSDK